MHGLHTQVVIMVIFQLTHMLFIVITSIKLTKQVGRRVSLLCSLIMIVTIMLIIMLMLDGDSLCTKRHRTGFWFNRTYRPLSCLRAYTRSSTASTRLTGTAWARCVYVSSNHIIIDLAWILIDRLILHPHPQSFVAGTDTYTLNIFINMFYYAVTVITFTGVSLPLWRLSITTTDAHVSPQFGDVYPDDAWYLYLLVAFQVMLVLSCACCFD